MTLEAPKTCVTCAHLLGRRVSIEYHQGWVCGAPENISSHVLNLVSGMEEAQYTSPRCTATRQEEGACGPLGKWWVLYEKPDFTKGLQQSNADNLLKLLEIS